MLWQQEGRIRKLLGIDIPTTLRLAEHWLTTMRVAQEAPRSCRVEICRRHSAVWAKRWRGKKMMSIFFAQPSFCLRTVFKTLCRR